MKTSKSEIQYLETLKEIAPSIALEQGRTIDEYYQWDGDGPDPAEEGYAAYYVTVKATAIVNGSKISGNDSLGGCYYQHGETIGEIHGYLPQMLESAIEELLTYGDLTGDIKSQGEAALKFCQELMRQKYNEQITAKQAAQ